MKSPVGHMAEALISAFSSLYRTLGIFRPPDFDRMLQAVKWMSIRAQETLEKSNTISSHGNRHYGRYQVGAHGLSFRRSKCERAKFTLAWVPVSLKSRSWELSRSLCDSGSIANYHAPSTRKSREQMSRLCGLNRIAASRVPAFCNLVVPKQQIAALKKKNQQVC